MESSPLPILEMDLHQQIIEVLRTCFDPEIPVNIYDLGLIYDIEIDEASNVLIRMTLTSPACPVAEILPPQVQNKVEQIVGVNSVEIELVWEPQWGPSRMTEAARLQLGLFD
jgi:FeS assembly SUF system protein